jgi:hypothetical protein
MADLSPVPPAVPQQQPLSPVPPRRPSLDDVVFGAFGMDPSLKRATLLPVAMNAAGEREWAVPQAVVDMLSSAMLPGHVMKGGAWSPQDVTKMALDVGMLGAPVGAATAPAGALGMFAGKAAKTADHAALARAEAMEQAGADAAKVWDETGWFRGADDKWRFEIPDDTAKLTLSGRTKETMADDLSRMMFHRNAYDAYPDAKRIYTTAEGLAGDRISGFHQPKKARAHMGLFDIDEQIHVQGPDRRSTALHELQHAIQQREGFAKGGSPQYGVSGPIHYPSFELPMWDVLKAADQLKRLSDQFGEPVPAMAAKYRGAFKIDDDLMAQAVALTGDPNLPSMFERGKLWAEMKPHEAYRRLAGEVEARNVQSRMDMTPEQRRAAPPWTTQDTPFEQQIVRMNANGPQAMERNGQPLPPVPPLPMDEALAAAQRNAALPVDQGGLGLPPSNTPEMRAAALGYDVDAYHATRETEPFSAFRPGMWGSTYLAASPRRAEIGAAAGAQELTHLSAPSGGPSSVAIMPLRVRGDDIAGLRPSREAWEALPDVAPQQDIGDLARSVGGRYWWDVYDEIQIKPPKWDKSDNLVDPGEYVYRKMAYPEQQYTPDVESWQASQPMLGGYNSGSDSAELARVAKGGQKGFLVSDEAGASIVASADMPIRSRFAAFDPMRRNSADLLAGLAAAGLMLPVAYDYANDGAQPLPPVPSR